MLASARRGTQSLGPWLELPVLLQVLAKLVPRLTQTHDRHEAPGQTLPPPGRPGLQQLPAAANRLRSRSSGRRLPRGRAAYARPRAAWAAEPRPHPRRWSDAAAFLMHFEPQCRRRSNGMEVLKSQCGPSRVSPKQTVVKTTQIYIYIY